MKLRGRGIGTGAIGRRSMIKAVGAAGVAALAAPMIMRGAQAQSKELVYATWGGSWEEAMRKAWFE
ncbi:MAG: ABC transporter substrate-binding protein, partial [Alphaproteobacteria bacterium]|nr:ABC transporter substrate-binding protein [Alphaproteobacteria bacterium]